MKFSIAALQSEHRLWNDSRGFVIWTATRSKLRCDWRERRWSFKDGDGVFEKVIIWSQFCFSVPAFHQVKMEA